MYRLKIDEGGEEATPPALILAIKPEYLELIRQDQDKYKQKAITRLAGQLAVNEFVFGDERIGFGGVAVVDQISVEETRLVLGMPPKMDEPRRPRHQKIKEIAATIHVATSSLNSLYDSNRRRFPQPQIHLTTVVSAEPYNYYSHFMSAKLAPELVKNIIGLTEEERSELQRQTKLGMTLFKDYLLTGTGLSTVRADIGADGMIEFDCPGGSCGLNESGRGNELVGHNVETPAQQIMLIGGLAAIATYAPTKQPK